MNVCTSSEMLAILSSAKTQRNIDIVHKWRLGLTFFPKELPCQNVRR